MIDEDFDCYLSGIYMTNRFAINQGPPSTVSSSTSTSTTIGPPTTDSTSTVTSTTHSNVNAPAGVLVNNKNEFRHDQNITDIEEQNLISNMKANSLLPVTIGNSTTPNPLGG